MPLDTAEELFRSALDEVIGQLNCGELGEINEATVQHHLALSMHLLARQKGLPFSINMERRVRRANGAVFPKKQSETAEIDIFFTFGEGQTRCAVELKLFKRINHREQYNRYDSYADLANLEVYLEEHSDLGFFVLLTDHPHYYDPEFRAHRPNTAAFCLRNDHVYQAGSRLIYEPQEDARPPLVLCGTYAFQWQNGDREWRVLVLKVPALTGACGSPG